MASATFILKESNSLEETLVYLVFRFKNQRLKYSTGQKIDPQFWNPVVQKARETRLFPGYFQFNALLKKIEAEIFNIYRKFLNEDLQPNPEQLRDALNNALGRNDRPSKLSFIEFAEKFVDSCHRRPNTIKNYKQTIKILTAYSKEK